MEFPKLHSWRPPSSTLQLHVLLSRDDTPCSRPQHVVVREAWEKYLLVDE